MTRIAVCGVGNIGRVHVANLLNMRGCTVTGIYDLDTTLLNEVCLKHNVSAYPDSESIFNDTEVDAVVIATPSGSHRQLTEKALAAGKHVFVEKPVAGTMEDATAIMDAVQARAGLIVQVGFCERFNPQFIEAKRAVDAGSLGTVRCIQSSRVSPYALGDPSWELGVLDTAIHNFDLALWLLREMPARVFARGVRLYDDSQIAQSVTTLLEFPSGALVTDTVTWIAGEKHPLSHCARARMQIIGSDGSFEVDLSKRSSSLLTSSMYREVDTVILGGDGYYGCLKLQFESFLRSIEEGAPVIATVEDAMRAERVALAAQASLISGRMVELG
jgi:predicted dehydrogenase